MNRTVIVAALAVLCTALPAAAFPQSSPEKGQQRQTGEDCYCAYEGYGAFADCTSAPSATCCAVACPSGATGVHILKPPSGMSTKSPAAPEMKSVKPATSEEAAAGNNPPSEKRAAPSAQAEKSPAVEAPGTGSAPAAATPVNENSAPAKEEARETTKAAATGNQTAPAAAPAGPAKENEANNEEPDETKNVAASASEANPPAKEADAEPAKTAAASAETTPAANAAGSMAAASGANTTSKEPAKAAVSAVEGHVAEPKAGAPSAVGSDYVIGDSDLLTISVWHEPDLTRDLTVLSDGKISLPLLGDVQASGLTERQLSASIRDKLRAYIEDPIVVVHVRESRSHFFTLVGDGIQKPGTYPLGQQITVLDAIALGGGFKDFARRSQIHIMRKHPDGSMETIRFDYKAVTKTGDPAKNPFLQPRDTVVVP